MPEPINIDSIYRELVDQPGNKRSKAYLAGARYGITIVIQGVARPRIYRDGTAQYDAFEYGEAEGRRRASRAIQDYLDNHTANPENRHG